MLFLHSCLPPSLVLGTSKMCIHAERLIITVSINNNNNNDNINSNNNNDNDSGATCACKARAWAEPYSLVNLPIPENLVIT